jgi:hypothetical protein
MTIGTRSSNPVPSSGESAATLRQRLAWPVPGASRLSVTMRQSHAGDETPANGLGRPFRIAPPPRRRSSPDRDFLETPRQLEADHGAARPAATPFSDEILLSREAP